MATLDTNVLVRFLVQDDTAQGKAAQTLIGRSLARGDDLFVPVTVVLELEWVLRSAFGFDKQAATAALFKLLGSFELDFESESAVEFALAAYERGTADFADCLHTALARQANCAPMWTFDKRAARLDGARLLVA